MQQDEREARAMVRGCIRKQYYRRERDALNALKRIRRRFGKSKTDTLVAYSCRFCGGWHLGNEHRG